MRPSEDIEKLVKKNRYEFSSETREKVFGNVLNEIEKQTEQHAGVQTPALWSIIMKNPAMKLSAAVITAMIVVLIFNQFTRTSIVWADVMEKLGNDIISTNNIHVIFKIQMSKTQQTQNASEDSSNTQTIKGEYWMQRNPLKGKFVLEGEQTNYFSGDKFIGIDHPDKEWFEGTISSQENRKKMLGIFDSLVTGDFKSYFNLPGYKISKGRVVGNEIIADKNTTIYQFNCEPIEDSKNKLPIQLKCWINNSDHKTVKMIYNYPLGMKYFYELIEYDAIISKNTFEVNIPEGYTKSLTPEERMIINLPTNIVTLKDNYDKNRDNLQNYRMIVTDEQGFVKYQVARQGKKWRRDSFQWTILKRRNIHIDTSLGFDDLWEQVSEISNENDERESTYMSYNNEAVIGYWLEGELENRYIQLPDYFALDSINTLEQVIWPDIDCLKYPDANITVLEMSKKYPGCKGIRVEYISGVKSDRPIAVLIIFWIDPMKNYMCIRYEQHQRNTALWENNLAWEPNEPIVPYDMNEHYNDNYMDGKQHSRIVEITATAQTPQGFWYPTERIIKSNSLNYKGQSVENSDKKERFYIDFDGPIDPNWFEWPKELPPLKR